MKSTKSPVSEQVAKPSTSRELMTRVVVVVLVVVSAGLLFFSLARLALAQRETARLTSLVQGQMAEIDNIRMRWNPAATSRVSQAYTEGKTTLMRGEDALSAWMDRVRQQASPLALEVKESFGPPHAHPQFQTNFTLMPVTLDIRPLPGEEATRRPYERLLELCQVISVGKERVDWLDISVFGASNSVNRAEVHLQLWLADSLPD